MSTATKGLLEKDKLSLQGFYAFSSHMTLDLLALRTWWQQWLPLRHGLDAFFHTRPGLRVSVASP